MARALQKTLYGIVMSWHFSHQTDLAAAVSPSTEQAGEIANLNDIF
jgi:hypothetical protein